MAWWVFQNLVATTALAVLVIGACRVMKPGPVAKHALWLLVLIKFVTPPIVEWPWALPDPMGLSASQMPFAESRGDRSAITARFDSVPAVAGATDTEHAIAPLFAEPAPAASSSINWALLIAAVWISGSVWMLAIEAVRDRRMARRLRTSSRPDAATSARVRELAALMGVTAPAVRVIDGTHAPFIWPAGAATLVLPGEWPADTTKTSIDGLIVHELAHLKRRDHFVAWMQLVAGVIWWWNPLFWYVRATVREQAELACDGWVISTLPDGRRAYAESLITLSGPALQGRSTPSMAAVVGANAVSRRMLERRLVMIMKGRTPLRLPVTGFVTLALAAAVTLPAWASVDQKQPPPPPAPPVVVKKSVSQQPAMKVPVAPRFVQKQNPPPPPPKPVPVSKKPLSRYHVELLDGKTWTVHLSTAKLPDEAQTVLATAASEEVAIRADAESRVAAKKAETTKKLEALQEQYTKAGKLDEAVAIRDYLAALSKAPRVIKR